MLWGTAGSGTDPGAEKERTPARKHVTDLFRATTGSAGLDLCSTSDIILTPEMGMQVLPTGVFGPLPPKTVGLLLGRSSSIMKGIHVSPGIIDEDFTGEIKIMVHSPLNISAIPAGTRIAQLIILPRIKVGKNRQDQKRGDRGFGSSDAYWIQEIKRDRPVLLLKINGKSFQGILDTGADVSCISAEHWPSKWPALYTNTSLQGIGQSQSPLQSSDLLSWQDQEGHQGTFQPYIIPGLPVNLWGRDIMSDMGVYLFSPNTQVTQQMFDQGLLPGQGLIIEGQGRQKPISPNPNLQKTGLGYFPRGS
ncbi:hypothetical protein mRhiFer1_009672 [Rhinolophus ferrumequinum]|uniref:Peptidase A2 domain-containing protein n=1 Tax=Rhinolophus ferrumequinum TaxID=59479 RepID=A0A7J7R3J6_RHIFE|nr:hypothetical protein mRhiFer1_009672 [Rhinolophus ferrumequinum]